MPPAHELTAPSPRVPALSVPRVAVRYRVALAVLALTALTFLIPSAPTYDPWAWIIWGREILHLDLSTVDGPSWKPLPVLLTTPFALFGGLAPDLWLFVARAGAIAGVVMAFRVARRLGGVPAGAAAAGAYAVAPWMLRNSALGNSEGLLVALGLAAVDRHLAGRTRHAFLFGIGAALLRPEAWPLIGLYGLWLFWRDPGARKLVARRLRRAAGAVAAARAVGLGRPAARRAPGAQPPRQQRGLLGRPDPRGGAPVRARCSRPALWIGLGALVAMMALRLGSGRRERRAAIGLALAGAVWVARGRRDDQRRLQRQRPLPDHAGGRRLRAGRDGHRLAGPRPAGALVRERGSPSRRCPSWPPSASPRRASSRLDAVRASVYYQARLTDGLAGRHRAGRRPRSPASAAARTYTGAFQVPSVAWLLRRAHDDRAVGERAGRPAAEGARASSLRSQHDEPAAARRAAASRASAARRACRRFAISGGWRIVGNCG